MSRIVLWVLGHIGYLCNSMSILFNMLETLWMDFFLLPFLPWLLSVYRKSTDIPILILFAPILHLHQNFIPLVIFMISRVTVVILYVNAYLINNCIISRYGSPLWCSICSLFCLKHVQVFQFIKYCCISHCAVTEF